MLIVGLSLTQSPVAPVAASAAAAAAADTTSGLPAKAPVPQKIPPAKKIRWKKLGKNRTPPTPKKDAGQDKKMVSLINEKGTRLLHLNSIWVKEVTSKFGKPNHYNQIPIGSHV